MGAYLTKHRSDRLIKLKAHFGGKCLKCGYSKCLDALTFHTKEVGQKEFVYRDYRHFSWQKQVEELSKCELVCLNCRAESH